MTERTELINDIEKLKAERNRLLRQVEEAEQWEGAAWDSFNSLAELKGFRREFDKFFALIQESLE
ncbi:TPA: hypothetical protein VVM08_002158 [Streptococcus pneumoniae]|nr:hypothetical protein [Streptococcus pneumoniae]